MEETKHGKYCRWSLRWGQQWLPHLYLCLLSETTHPHEQCSHFFHCTAVYCWCTSRSSAFCLWHSLQVSSYDGFFDLVTPCPDNVSIFLLCTECLLCPPVCFVLELCSELPAKAGWSPYLCACFLERWVRPFIHLEAVVLKDIQHPWALHSCSQDWHIQ